MFQRSEPTGKSALKLKVCSLGEDEVRLRCAVDYSPSSVNVKTNTVKALLAFQCNWVNGNENDVLDLFGGGGYSSRRFLGPT